MEQLTGIVVDGGVQQSHHSTPQLIVIVHQIILMTLHQEQTGKYTMIVYKNKFVLVANI